MNDRLDLDYCPRCDMPTFGHQVVAQMHGEYYHIYCVNQSVMVAKREQLRNAPIETI